MGERAHGAPQLGQIARYKRTAESFEELGLGKLDPLNEAIRELRVGHEMSQTR